MTESPQSIIELWFSDDVRPLWFNSTPTFDEQLRDRFESLWQKAVDGKLDHWAKSAEGTLALVILLDQIPLNIYRGKAQSFATETKAREIAAYAIEQGWDTELTGEQKAFLYMPFMHSESLADQDRSVGLYEAAGLQDNLKFAKHHRELIRRFGRFPHRNAILRRESTTAELTYLASDDAFHG